MLSLAQRAFALGPAPGPKATVMKTHTPAADPKSRRELKRAAGIGLALFAAGLMTLLYLRTSL